MNHWFEKEGRKNTQAEQQKEKNNLKNQDSIRNILDNMKHNNIGIMGMLEVEESEQRIENLFEEIITENFPNLEAGCSQEEGPKKGFVMGSRTRGVQEILEKCM